MNCKYLLLKYFTTNVYMPNKTFFKIHISKNVKYILWKEKMIKIQNYLMSQYLSM